MTKLTRHQFPAAVTAVEPDGDELPTDPMIPLPERDTERPSGNLQSALREATRPSQDWRYEPRWAVDPVTSHMVLAEPYEAWQSDRWGNRYHVGCPVGTELPLPTSRDQGSVVRSVLVAVVLRQRRDTTICYAHDGSAGVPIPIDDQWRAEITQAFIDGDARRLPRG